jgi:hypothetical protein
MEVVVSDRSSQPSRLRFVCVAATLAFCISAILFLTVPRVVLEAANSKAHVGTAGVWNHDEFRAKKIWLHGTTSIHSPAEEAVQAALKETERVSPFLSFYSQKSNASVNSNEQANEVLGKVRVDSALKKISLKSGHYEKPSSKTALDSPEQNAVLTFASNPNKEPSTWMGEDKDVSNLLQSQGKEVVFPTSLDKNSPAALAAAASAIARAASDVADQSQRLQTETNSYNHYVDFDPALQSSVMQPSLPTIGLEQQGGLGQQNEAPVYGQNPSGKQGKLAAIQNQLSTLENVVMKLVQAIKPAARGSISPAAAYRAAVSGGRPLAAAAPSRPGKRTALREDDGAADPDSLEAMQAQYRAEGSQNPEADAAIEKVLHDLNKGH